MKWVKVLGGVVGVAALLGLGIILGHFAIPKGADPLAPSVSQDLDLEILETVMGQLDASRIRETLRELSREPHLASSPRDEALVQLLLQRWRDPESGLDSAGTSTYEVLLSFPSQEQPNRVAVVAPTGDILFSCRQSEENLTEEQAGPDVVSPYAAYAPSGTPQGLLVYANWGMEEDFEELQTQGIELKGTIALTRYGGIGRGAKAVNAAKYQVAGVLVYTDPADINDGHSLPNETFPYSWYLPPSGVERGSYYEYFGDPLTPYLPANPSSFRLDPATASGFPPIPTQPIGFEDAKVLLCNLQGTSAPAAWQGALGCDYKLGPGFQPDGAFASTWRPRRSVVFASWGAEEFGLIGSTEFTEEFFSKLQERTVAYINVDISVFANATLRVQGTPPVQSVVFSAAKQIPAPDPSRLSIYDNWIRYFNRSSPVYGLVPRLGSLGAGSDYAPFIHFLGISSMDIAYTYDQSKTSARIYPTYHTAFDTFSYVDKFVDPGFGSHRAVAQTAGNVLLRLSDSLFLPLNVSDYSETLRSFLQAAQQDLGALLEQHSISLGPLVTAVEKFEEASIALGQNISALQKANPNPLQVRMLNDQLMLLERTFLNPRAFPEERYYSHVLWAPRTSSVATFPGLANACSRAMNTSLGSAAWAEVQRQLSIVVAALEGAAATLRPVDDL
ncbi:N-acetylated-alpha-linked acidic dipeptidase-like protein [Pteropus vampyrus]|uniref:Aminopeptidase NAALADL1 n=1 Tax=Pteropus vampyrus TaxID=132908 RepID=A0A6P3QW71_PTEVA|nr:N-acetylated-alpha-linked acidic dipeptidase-like protein [Pteropus vampyrus]